MNLLVIPIQSISDVITNSSSELFVLNTNDTEERVKEILAKITYGYQEPIKFSLEEYKTIDTSEYHYGTYISSIHDNFYDFDDPIDRARCIIHNLDWQYEDSDFALNFRNFTEENNLPDSYWEIEEYGGLQSCVDWLASQQIPEWALPENESLQWLDGKILVLSEYDNSMPCDTFNLIKNLFNAKRIHLG